MTLLMVLLTIAVVAGVAAVVSGAVTSGLDGPEPQVPVRALPTGPLTGQDVTDLRFVQAFRGYRMDQVDAAMDALAAEVDRLRALLPEGVADRDLAVREVAPAPLVAAGAGGPSSVAIGASAADEPAGHAPATGALATVAPAAATSADGATAVDTSAVDSSAVDSSTVDTSAVDTSTVDSSAVDTPAVDPPAVAEREDDRTATAPGPVPPAVPPAGSDDPSEPRNRPDPA